MTEQFTQVCRAIC